MRLTHYTFMHTTDHKWTVDVFKALDDMNAPDYAFDNILAWARGASAAHYSFNPQEVYQDPKVLICFLMQCQMRASCYRPLYQLCAVRLLKQERNEDKQPIFQAIKAS